MPCRAGDWAGGPLPAVGWGRARLSRRLVRARHPVDVDGRHLWLRAVEPIAWVPIGGLL